MVVGFFVMDVVRSATVDVFLVGFVFIDTSSAIIEAGVVNVVSIEVEHKIEISRQFRSIAPAIIGSRIFFLP